MTSELDLHAEEVEESCPPLVIEPVDSVQSALDRICDPKLKKSYLSYVKLLKQIEKQNLACERIKDTIKKTCSKEWKSECEEREIRVMRCSLENENFKLMCFIQEAIRLQNENPDQHWPEITVSTNIDEEFMPTQMDMNLSERLTDRLCNRDCNLAWVSCDICDLENHPSFEGNSQESKEK